MPRKTTSKALPGADYRARDLSREKVVEVAIAVLDTDGSEALSLRSVARALGVTPMALYNHFSSKGDLEAAVADAIIQGAVFDGGHSDWRDQIRHCFKALRNVCLRHPALPGLIQREAMAPRALLPMHVTFKALESTGLSQLDRLRAFYLLTGYTLSQAAHQAEPFSLMTASKQNRQARVKAREGKEIEVHQTPADWDYEASFEFGLTIVLNGIAATVSNNKH